MGNQERDYLVVVYMSLHKGESVHESSNYLCIGSS